MSYSTNASSPLKSLQTLGLDVNLDLHQSITVKEQFYPSFLKDNFTNITVILDEFRTSLTNIKDITVITLISLYSLVFILGLIGNCIIIYFANKTKQQIQSRARNKVFINLCIADLLVILVCCPVTAYSSATKVWVLGHTLCKLLSYLQGMAVTAGTLSLTVLSLYRYIFIRYPNLYKKLSGKYLLNAMITSVWVIAALISLPMIFTRTMQELRLGSIHVKFCIEQWHSDINRRAFTIVTLVIVYALPCSVLIICHSGVSSTLCTTEKSLFLNRNNSRQKSFRCKSSFDIPPTPPNTIANSYYSDNYHSSCQTTQMSDRQVPCTSVDKISKTNAGLKSRRKLANLLMGMTSCFVICWLPYNITSFYVDLYPTHSLIVFLPFTLLLGHSHSAINPLVYWFMNRNVRLKVKDAFINKSVTKKNPVKNRSLCANFGHNRDSVFTSDSVLGIFHPKYTLKEFSAK